MQVFTWGENCHDSLQDELADHLLRVVMIGVNGRISLDCKAVCPEGPTLGPLGGWHRH